MAVSRSSGDRCLDYLESGLPELLQVLEGTDVCELHLQKGDLRVRVHRLRSSIGESLQVEDSLDRPSEETGPAVVQVRATVVGTFYRAGHPGMEPLVVEGSQVEENTVIGIIEALQVLTDIEAGYAGTVTAVLATDGQPVEYGQPLVEVLLDG